MDWVDGSVPTPSEATSQFPQLLVENTMPRNNSLQTEQTNLPTVRTFGFLAIIAAIAVVLPFPLSDTVYADWSQVPGSRQVEILEKFRNFSPTFYISTEGSDSWTGKLAQPNDERTDGPFRSFEKAREAVRDFRKSGLFEGKVTVVEVQPGTYELDAPIAFGQEDSGTDQSPIVWRGSNEGRQVEGKPGARNESKVVLSGACRLQNPKPVDDPAILARIKPEARGKVVQFDLKECGVTDFGKPNGKNNAELFLNNSPMTVARYPNEGFIKIADLDFEGSTEVDVRGTKGINEPQFFVKEDISAWAGEPDGWAFGYWFFDWATSRQKLASVDPKRGRIALEPPFHGYGYRKDQYFYVYNMLCELDMPGEYVIDRQTGILYFYPPENLEGAELFLTHQQNIATFKDISNLAFCGFTLQGCRDKALTINAQDSIVCDCTVKNTGECGMSVQGSNILVFGNHLYNLGAGGISVNGGDRATLAPGKIAVVNNDIHDYGRVIRMYAAGIHMNGCGNLVAHNRITDAPHCAILFGGNEQILEMNEIGRVCQESNDAGAIYSGRNWTMRGNIIRNNYMHDVTGFQNKGCVGVYLDDMFSSADIVGNLFVNVTNAAFIGGGRDCGIINNIFVNCNPAIHVDARALTWCNDHADSWLEEAAGKGTISGIDYRHAPYSERYPELLSILENTPKAPEGNVIANNAIIESSWNNRQPDVYEGNGIEGIARPYLKLENNIIGDYRLLLALSGHTGSALPNPKIHFDRIPTERIGRFDHPSATARP